MANSVESFTTCLLDPLRYDQDRREKFGDGLDEILKDAIQLNQKKVGGMKNRTAQLTYPLSFLYKNIFYKNIEAEICEILKLSKE